MRVTHAVAMKILQNQKPETELIQQSKQPMNNYRPFPPYAYSLLRRASNAPEHPWDIAYHIHDHKYVMDIMIVARRDVHPSTAGESAYNPKREHDGGEAGRA